MPRAGTALRYLRPARRSPPDNRQRLRGKASERVRDAQLHRRDAVPHFTHNDAGQPPLQKTTLTPISGNNSFDAVLHNYWQPAEKREACSLTKLLTSESGFWGLQGQKPKPTILSTLFACFCALCLSVRVRVHARLGGSLEPDRSGIDEMSFTLSNSSRAPRTRCDRSTVRCLGSSDYTQAKTPLPMRHAPARQRPQQTCAIQSRAARRPIAQPPPSLGAQDEPNSSHGRA